MSVPLTDFTTPVNTVLFGTGIAIALWFDTGWWFIAAVALAAVIQFAAVYIDRLVDGGMG